MLNKQQIITKPQIKIHCTDNHFEGTIQQGIYKLHPRKIIFNFLLNILKSIKSPLIAKD